MPLIDEEKLTQVKARLRTLCEEMDSDAEEVIEREAALLQAGHPAHFLAIAAAVRGFEFEQAVLQIDAAVAARSV